MVVEIEDFSERPRLLAVANRSGFRNNSTSLDARGRPVQRIQRRDIAEAIVTTRVRQRVRDVLAIPCDRINASASSD